jgi:hypothetical protein
MISRFESEKGLAAENDPPRAVKPGVLSNIRIASPLRVIEMVDTRISCRIAECQGRNRPFERSAESLSSTLTCLSGFPIAAIQV